MRKQLADGKTLADVVAVWNGRRNTTSGTPESKIVFDSIRSARWAYARFEALRRFMQDLRAVVKFDAFTIQGRGRGTRDEGVSDLNPSPVPRPASHIPPTC